MKEKNEKKVNRINYLLDEENYEIAGGQNGPQESSEFDSDEDSDDFSQDYHQLR